jgi:tRNA pseudouridine13 synthase
MIKIKQIPEDFIVKEIFEKKKRERISKSFERNFYIWFTLKKRNYDLFQALKILSKRLGVSIKRFGYAGTKDKRAVTSQKISVWNVPLERLKRLKIKDIELSDFEIRKDRINLGDLKGNWFKITIRDIILERKELKKKLEKKIESMKESGVINLFGEQRFGLRKNTHLIGKEIIKGNLKKAVWDYLTFVSGKESEDEKNFRKNLKKLKNPKQGLKEIPKGLTYESVLLNHLVRYPNDYAGALRRLPKKLRRLFIHAYQAHLWNRIAIKLNTKENIKIPLIGFETNLEKYKKIKKIIERILKEEGVETSEFKVKRMPELASEGSERYLRAFPKKIKFKIENDELNKGKNKVILEFEIPRGSYATIVLKNLIEGDTSGN